MVEMKNFFKGLAYTVFAGLIGVGGYMLGKYRHMGGKVSLTMIGLAAVLYAPKGCDVIETYIEKNSEVQKVRVLEEMRRDSLDLRVLSKKSSEASETNLENTIYSLSKSQDSLKNSYGALLRDAEYRYKQLIEQNDAASSTIISGLTSELDMLKNTVAVFDGTKTNAAELIKYPDAQLEQINSSVQALADASNSEKKEVLYGSIPKYYKKYYGDGRIQLARDNNMGIWRYANLGYGPRLKWGFNAKDEVVRKVLVTDPEEIALYDAQYNNEAFWGHRY